jgi:DamX protein
VIPEGYKPLAIPESEQNTISEQEDTISANQDLQIELESTEGKDSDLGSVSEESDLKLEQTDALPQEQTAQEPTTPVSDGDVSQPKEQKISVAEKPALPEAEEVKQSPPSDPMVEEKSALPEKQPAKPVGPDGKVAKKSLAEKKAGEILPQIKKPSKPVVVAKQPDPQPAKPTVKNVVSEVASKPKPAEAAPQAPEQSKASNSAAPVEDRSVVLVKKEAAAVSVIKKPVAAAPKPSKVAAKPVSKGLLRERWLLQQKPSSYTIQLVGLQDEKGVAKFIQRHSLTGPIAYYRTQRSGKPWYPVLYGVYSTKVRANSARNNLPEAILKSGPWLRSLNAVQKDIRAR